MLEHLHIQGIALIEDISLSFGPEMNAVTGETGAGKSFILKALSFVLGEKAKIDMLRPGNSQASVEAIFSLNGERLCITRELFSTGRSKIKINGKATSQEVVRALREQLLAYTGQHGQQKLLQTSFLEQLFEQSTVNLSLRQQRTSILAKLEEFKKKLKSLEERKASLAQSQEFLELQAQEIDSVNPQAQEDEEMEAIRIQIRRAEEANKSYAKAQTYLYGDGEVPGLLEMTSSFARFISHMKIKDKKIEELSATLANFEHELRNIASLLSRPVEVDDSLREIDIEQVEERLFLLSQLKRKLHRSLPEILSLRQEIQEKLSFLQLCDIEKKNIDRKEKVLCEELSQLLESIIPLRRQGCLDRCKKLEETLKELGFSKEVQVLPAFEKNPLWKNIIDEKVKVLWAPNPGQKPQALDKIASGGELSRFLLALVSTFPVAQDTSFIFDEIDAGVGGITLGKLANRLEAISKKHQIIIITHWPQIAVRAQKHFYIAKTIHESMTFTQCTELDSQERQKEIARMAGGGIQGEAMAQALFPSKQS